MTMVHCTACGKEVAENAAACPNCGAPQMGDRSEKSYVATLLLCFFLGGIGVHRFFVGKIGTGILMLLTLGGLGIWTLIDFIVIAIGNFTDGEGKPIKS